MNGELRVPNLKLPCWLRVLVMVLSVIAVLWALVLMNVSTDAENLSDASTVFFFASAGAFVCYMLLRHVEHLGLSLQAVRDELDELKAQLAGSTEQPEEPGEEQPE